jgi:methylmalonyl-CoA mutase
VRKRKISKSKMHSDEKKRILDEFEAHSYADWKAAAEALLKGRDFDRTLRTPTYEGFTLEPIYMGSGAAGAGMMLPGMGDCRRGSRVTGFLEESWLVSQELSAPTPEEVNAMALEALNGGQNELNLWLDLPTRRGADISVNDASAGVCGLSLSTVGDMKRLLQGIHPEMISFYWHAGVSAPAILACFVTAMRERGQDLKGLKGCVGYDPVSWKLESGAYPGSEAAVSGLMADMVRFAEKEFPQMQVLDVQGHAYHDAGGSSVQEMAAVLATGVHYLRSLQAQGVEPGRVASRMRLSLSVGSQTFIEIAKLRAMRQLWTRILQVFGVAAEERVVHLHARTGLWNKTVLDPYVNMLRTTTEAFAAVLGGCDSLHVAPFDEVVRESDAFSRRIARNTHAILAEECELGRVIDPAGGSWAIENLTSQMAEQAWAAFQKIESAGGILEVLNAGSLQAEIEAVRTKKAVALQRRKDVLVGTNSYANATELLLKRPHLDYATVRRERCSGVELWKTLRDESGLVSALESLQSEQPGNAVAALLAASIAGATVGEMMSALNLGDPGSLSAPVKTRRGAEQFEQLRLAALALKAAGKSTKLLQINYGPSRGYRLRADWTSGFFQAGGLEVLNDRDFTDISSVLEALGESGARAAVITSSDAEYAEHAESLATAIKSKFPGIQLFLAGAPGDQELAYRASGIDDFVHIRVNAFIFNRDLLLSMGASVEQFK